MTDSTDTAVGTELHKLQVIHSAIREARSRSDRPEPPAVGAAAPDTLPGYTLTGTTHRGGQAVVYEAIQDGTKRRVAIKVMRRGPGSDDRDHARFEREVQLLAHLEHPNIVTIHDSSLTDSLSYFVMDYVDGLPLDEYVAIRKLDVDVTLELFARVCEAVHAAHLRGVIHRDLKPSNIRVDRDGKPHVLDFGLAKVVSTDATRFETMTMPGHFVGSLPWASPEQAGDAVGDVDVRSDVYSLGVILYQLLTDRFPYDVTGSVRTAMDNIANAEPARPGLQRPDINDEVETIVLKCLSKSRERRYETAGALARDIRRYLAGEPIEAKRDSSWYVVKKNLRRYRVQASVVTLIAMLVLGFGITMAIMFNRASAAEARLRYRAECENRATLALNYIIFNSTLVDEKVDPQLLEQSANKTVANLADRPLAQAILMDSIAQMCQGHRMMPEAVAWRRRALRTRIDDPASDEAELATAWFNLGFALRGIYEVGEAEQAFRTAMVIRRRVLGPEHAETAAALDSVARCVLDQGGYDEAEAGLREALRLRRVALPAGDPKIISNLCGLAGLLANRGGHSGYTEAEALCREAVGLVDEHYSRMHPVARGPIGTLAMVLHERGKFDEALELYRQSVVLARKQYPPEHPSFAGTLMGVGLCLKDAGRYAQAEPYILDAHRVGVAAYGERNAHAARSWHAVAKLYTDWGRLEEGLDAVNKSLELHVEFMGRDHRDTARPMTHKGRLLARLGRHEEAIPLLEEALAIRLEKKPPGHWKTAKTKSALGAAFAGIGRFEEAETLVLEAYPDIRDDRGPTHRRTREAIQRIIEVYAAWERDDEVSLWRQRLAEATPS